MSNRLERYLQEIWYGGRKPSWLLVPLEKLYYSVVEKKRRRFLAGRVKAYTPKAPVIVVGNITVGGTGKTPLTLYLIEAFAQRGVSVGVVSRGYGGKAAHYPIEVSAAAQSEQVGDEPLMIHCRSGVPVVVDPDRSAAAKYLEDYHSIDVIISDDGLQHYALNRTVEIVVMDGVRGIGNGRCLPSGPLREPVNRLADIDFLIINSGVLSEVAPSVNEAFNPKGVCYPMSIVADKMESIHSLIALREEQSHLDADQIAPPQQCEVYGVAGIGNPERFFTTLKKGGYRVIEKPFADHHRYELSDFSEMSDKPIVMTEKDAIKVQHLNLSNAWYLKVSGRVDAQLIDDILSKLELCIERP